jgi:16S rRNA (cytidine1402-2'-O)-methyltransferase
MKNKVYLIPTTLGESEIGSVIPNNVVEIVKKIKVFIIEDIRTARRYLRKLDRTFDIDSCVFFEINKHTKSIELSKFFATNNKTDIGIISEAGCPGIADPGADVVKLAHEKNMQVVPLVGPSSILMALISSGFNGQNFAFVGYIPINKKDRIAKILELEARSLKENQTQIFIETPFRNSYLFDDIVNTCSKNTKLCIATDISLDTEFIKTKSIDDWKKNKPNLEKRPTVFLIHKN